MTERIDNLADLIGAKIGFRPSRSKLMTALFEIGVPALLAKQGITVGAQDEQNTSKTAENPNDQED